MSATPRETRSGLGRGLAALIPPRPADARPAAPADIPVDQVVENPYQPRERMDPAQLEQLAASIREHGVLQPILVTETPAGYVLIAGERRLRASRIAGLARIPAVIRQAADRDRLELALVENLQRADLNPMEEARAYRHLIDDFGLTQDAVAQRVGRARPTITNSLRLLELSARVQGALAEGTVTAGHARAIAGLPAEDVQDELLAVVLARSLSVRQTEELARRLKEDRGAPRAVRGPRLDPDLERLEGELRNALGTKVSVKASEQGGRIVIEFYGYEDLERLAQQLIGRPA